MPEQFVPIHPGQPDVAEQHVRLLTSAVSLAACMASSADLRAVSSRRTLTNPRSDPSEFRTALITPLPRKRAPLSSRAAHVGVGGAGEQRIGDLRRPQNVVGVAAVDHVPRHRRELRALGVLRDAPPAHRLDRLRPLGAVGPHPAHDDRDGPLALLLATITRPEISDIGDSGSGITMDASCCGSVNPCTNCGKAGLCIRPNSGVHAPS